MCIDACTDMYIDICIEYSPSKGTCLTNSHTHVHKLTHIHKLTHVHKLAHIHKLTYVRNFTDVYTHVYIHVHTCQCTQTRRQKLLEG